MQLADTSHMQLSPKAIEELRAILRNDIGEEGLRRFTEEGLNDLGVRLLRLTAVLLKAEVKERKCQNDTTGTTSPRSLA